MAEFEPKALVRSFSSDLARHEAANATNLQLIVAESSKRDEQKAREDEVWRKYFEPWDPTEQQRKDAFLRKEGVLLSASWKAFREKLPKEDQAAFERRSPTIQDVIDTVNDAAEAWETKKQKNKVSQAARLFRKLGRSVDSHATMLELLPSGNEYVSLFTGTLKSLVKACANYDKIAQGLSRTLSELTDIVAGCTESCQLYPTEAMQLLIVKLYAHIFLLLRDMMTWYIDKQWKRVLHSFREDMYAEFEDQLKNIRSIAEDVKDRAHLGHSAESRVTRHVVEDSRLLLEGQARAIAEMDYRAQMFEARSFEQHQQTQMLMLEENQRLRQLVLTIANHTTSLLQIQAETWAERQSMENREVESTRALPPTRRLKAIGRAQDLETAAAGRSGVLVASGALENYFDRDRIRLLLDSEHAVFTDTRVSTRLQDWIAEQDTPLLALAGPSRTDMFGVSTMTKLAETFLEFAENAKLPVISYFCELRRDWRKDCREMQGLLALVYALIRQVIELLPEMPEEPSALDSGLFQVLDGTQQTVELALQLLKTLIGLVQLSILYCVIDGIQWLDDTSTQKHVEALVAILGRPDKDVQSGPRIRVLLTTSGRSGALLDCLQVKDYVLADRTGADTYAGPRASRRLVLD